MLGDSLISHKLQNLKLQPKVRNALALDKHLQTCSFLNCQIFSCNTFYYISTKWSKKSFQPNPIVPSQCLNSTENWKKDLFPTLACLRHKKVTQRERKTMELEWQRESGWNIPSILAKEVDQNAIHGCKSSLKCCHMLINTSLSFSKHCRKHWKTTATVSPNIKNSVWIEFYFKVNKIQ